MAEATAALRFARQPPPGRSELRRTIAAVKHISCDVSNFTLPGVPNGLLQNFLRPHNANDTAQMW